MQLSFFTVSCAQFNVQNGSNLAKLVDVLDQKMKNELIKWFLKQELSEYTVLFEENQEVSTYASQEFSFFCYRTSHLIPELVARSYRQTLLMDKEDTHRVRGEV